ncbi:MAG: winged helix-turn-helix transcriptional regulator, partial [Anaerolineae bacterium]
MFITDRWDMRLTDREVITALSRLDKPTSQTDIAEDLGCSIRTLSRAIKRLRAKGYIEPIGDGHKTPFKGYTIHYD